MPLYWGVINIPFQTVAWIPRCYGDGQNSDYPISLTQRVYVQAKNAWMLHSLLKH
ncbi:MAG: hypothetical protein OEV70_13325 [Nitrospirota bacterium]|nr:hypothetical protein [Nitrospirota bacterium]